MKFSWAIPAVDESLSVLDGLFRIISVQQEWRRNLILHCMRALIFASTVLTQYSVSLHSRTQVIVRCLSISLRFSKQHIHVWKQGRCRYFIFFLQEDLLLSCVLCIRHRGYKGSSDNSVNGERQLMAVRSVTPFSEVTELERSCDWEELKPFFSEKVWSQPIYRWSHFRDMLQQ